MFSFFTKKKILLLVKISIVIAKWHIFLKKSFYEFIYVRNSYCRYCINFPHFLQARYRQYFEEDLDPSNDEAMIPMETQVLMQEVLTDGMAFCSLMWWSRFMFSQQPSPLSKKKESLTMKKKSKKMWWLLLHPWWWWWCLYKQPY